MGFKHIFNSFLKSKSKLPSQNEKLPFLSVQSQDIHAKQSAIEPKEAVNTSFGDVRAVNTSSWAIQLPTTLPTLQRPQTPSNRRRRRIPEGQMHQLNDQYAELVIKLQSIPRRKRKYPPPVPAAVMLSSAAATTRGQPDSCSYNKTTIASSTTGTINADMKKESALDRLVKRRSEQTTEHMRSSIMSLSEARRSSLQVICEDTPSEMNLSAASLTNSDGGGRRSSKKAESVFVWRWSGSKNRLTY